MTTFMLLISDAAVAMTQFGPLNRRFSHTDYHSVRFGQVASFDLISNKIAFHYSTLLAYLYTAMIVTSIAKAGDWNAFLGIMDTRDLAALANVLSCRCMLSKSYPKYHRFR